jgi:hypothetical protein
VLQAPALLLLLPLRLPYFPCNPAVEHVIAQEVRRRRCLGRGGRPIGLHRLADRSFTRLQILTSVFGFQFRGLRLFQLK